MSVRARCPECNGASFVHDYEQGEVVCTGCGCVLYDKVKDFGPEWRAFDGEQREKKTRAGAPLTLTIHDKGLSTMIDWQDKDVHGRSISPGRKARLYSLRKWQSRTRIFNSMERNLASALFELSRLSSLLGLPRDTTEMASFIYRRAVKRKLMRGRSIKGMAAAAVYLACRRLGLTRTLQEIAMATSLSRKDIARSYRFILNELNDSVEPPSPFKYVSKIANQLGVSGTTEAMARNMLQVARSTLLTSGRGPASMAASALYMASVITNQKKTQRELADIAGVTEVTIRNRCKELLQTLDLILEL